MKLEINNKNREKTVFEEPSRMVFLINKKDYYFSNEPLGHELAKKVETHETDFIKINKKFGKTSILCVSFEKDSEYKKLIDRGEFFGKTDKLKKGRHCSCHQNSCNLVEKYPDKYQMATGYALSEDLVWRCHSWLIEKDKKDKKLIVETTVPRIMYYGYIMTKEEQDKFIEENF